MILWKLAWKNLYGTGIRFILNTSVISISIIIIIFTQAMYAGLAGQMLTSIKNTESCDGQFIAENFDYLDNLKFEHTAPIPDFFKNNPDSCGILFNSGTLYLKDRSFPIVMRGIDTEQSILSLPTKTIRQYENTDICPVFIGIRMKKLLKLEKGDIFTLKWRDSKGVFDAAEFRIMGLMNTSNPRVDERVVWLPLKRLQEMTDNKNRISYIVIKNTGDLASRKFSGFHFSSHEELTASIIQLIEDDKKWMNVIYLILLLLCSVGIFNAQILAVFKRKKEIGTLMAMGMKKNDIVKVFSYEGIITSLLGLAGTLFPGSLIFYMTVYYGLPMGHTEGMGMPVPETLIPLYTNEIIFKSCFTVFLIMAVISWFPVRKISNMIPAVILRGSH